MFIKSNIDKTKTLKAQIYKAGMRLPVFPVRSLLANQQHQFLLTQLRELSRLPDDQHDALYQTFIYRFVECVQVLPKETDESLCSLMNEGLMRGMNALHHYLLLNKEASPLERYAIFTAAVLVDIAAVLINQKIFITDEEGKLIKHWEPFSGSLVEVAAEFYKMMPLSSYYQRNIRPITTLLARQILPKSGFEWLSSDLKILADWLDALLSDNDDGGVGRFTRTIQLFKYHEVEGLVNHLPAVTVMMEESPATAHADAFFAWLKEGLAAKTIKVNTADAAVHVTTDGVFLDKPGIFKQFVDLYNVPVNMFSVYQQLGNLFGLTKLSGADYRHAQLFSEYPDFAMHQNKMGHDLLYMRSKSLHEGILIADPHLVFMQGEVPAPTTFLKPLPATEKPQHLPKLIDPQKKPENKI